MPISWPRLRSNPRQQAVDQAWCSTPIPPRRVTVSRGRDGSLLLNPVDGSVLQDASAGQREFFRVVENWHRRLAGEGTSTRAKLIDYGNLLFLFIIVSGIYIWLPQVWRWRNLRFLMFFQTKYVNAKARDFNWHHVFSFWMLIPLFVISLSGVVMSFDWANRMVYAAYGEEAPQRRGGGAGGAGNPGGPTTQGAERGNNRGQRDRNIQPAERGRCTRQPREPAAGCGRADTRLEAVDAAPGWRRPTGGSTA